MVKDEAASLIEILGLAPHPEGGHYRETFRDTRGSGGRAYSTAIYYLLRAGEESRWHRVKDAAELWHYYAGAPLLLETSSGKEGRRSILLGPDVTQRQQPQAVVQAGDWQSARTTGAYTLAGCTVAPGFIFESFEMAPTDWQPD